jgi:hypothetical protein
MERNNPGQDRILSLPEHLPPTVEEIFDENPPRVGVNKRTREQVESDVELIRRFGGKAAAQAVIDKRRDRIRRIIEQ